MDRGRFRGRARQTLRSTTEQSSEVLQKIQNQKAALEIEIASVASDLSTAQRHLTVLRQSEQVTRARPSRAHRVLAPAHVGCAGYLGPGEGGPRGRN